MRNLFVAVLLVISLMLVSCGKAPGSSEIIGKWKTTQVDRTIEFRQDGTVTMVSYGNTWEGTYKLEGKNLKVEFSSSAATGIPSSEITWKVSISGESLVIAMGEGRQTEAFTFEKVQ